MSLNPGKELKVSRYAVVRTEKLSISNLVALSSGELRTMEQISVTKEKELYGKIEDLINEWEEQAGETIRLRKAQEYLGSAPQPHPA